MSKWFSLLFHVQSLIDRIFLFTFTFFFVMKRTRGKWLKKERFLKLFLRRIIFSTKSIHWNVKLWKNSSLFGCLKCKQENNHKRIDFIKTINFSAYIWAVDIILKITLKAFVDEETLLNVFHHSFCLKEIFLRNHVVDKINS